MRALQITLLGWLVLLMVPRVWVTPAQAQVRAAAEARLRVLNRQAMSEYDALEFDSAKKKLQEALTVARRAQLDDGEQVVTTYINLGILFGAGFNDRIKAVEYFTKALTIDRSRTLDPARATPDLDEIFNTARDNVRPMRPAGFEHDPVHEATEGERVIISGSMRQPPPGLRCMLLYRPRGESSFVERVMRWTEPGVCTGAIPSRDVEPPSVHYYVEVRDRGGRRVSGTGSEASPMIIAVDRARGHGRRRRHRDRRKVISFALMIGSGGGAVFGGQSENNHRRVNSAALQPVDIQPGVAVTPLHLAAEIGYHLSPDWQISAMGRLQLVTALSGTTVVNRPNPISVMGLLRAKRFLGRPPLRFFFSFGAGGGQVRHRIELGDYDHNEDPTGSQTPNDIVDARVAGLAAFSFGGGFTWMFHHAVGIVVDANGMILVPDFAAHLDLNLGVVLSF